MLQDELNQILEEALRPMRYSQAVLSAAKAVVAILVVAILVVAISVVAISIVAISVVAIFLTIVEISPTVVETISKVVWLQFAPRRKNFLVVGNPLRNLNFSSTYLFYALFVSFVLANCNFFEIKFIRNSS